MNDATNGITMAQVLDYVRGCDRAKRDMIAEALHFARAVETHKAKIQFSPGDRVRFLHKGFAHRGTVTRLSRTTVMVRSESGTEWRVSPQLLSKEPA